MVAKPWGALRLGVEGYRTRRTGEGSCSPVPLSSWPPKDPGENGEVTLAGLHSSPSQEPDFQVLRVYPEVLGFTSALPTFGPEPRGGGKRWRRKEGGAACLSIPCTCGHSVMQHRENPCCKQDTVLGTWQRGLLIIHTVVTGGQVICQVLGEKK